ncbi:DgyrCDS8843 [Dimorphilus gyrociliatus]|uniref:DgyrCDS8843 n=1 Tax=Dimorphilus gyrociliatus TaxID=2664684 RepID=A0A7I8VXN7_9ANNE|nr:DgyrCDS8843 [Dimorphilus gyrociliatus]
MQVDKQLNECMKSASLCRLSCNRTDLLTESLNCLTFYRLEEDDDEIPLSKTENLSSGVVLKRWPNHTEITIKCSPICQIEAIDILSSHIYCEIFDQEDCYVTTDTGTELQQEGKYPLFLKQYTFPTTVRNCRIKLIENAKQNDGVWIHSFHLTLVKIDSPISQNKSMPNVQNILADNQQQLQNFIGVNGDIGQLINQFQQMMSSSSKESDESIKKTEEKKTDHEDVINKTKAEEKNVDNIMARIDVLMEEKFKVFSERLEDRLSSFEDHLVAKLTQALHNSKSSNTKET